MAAFRYHLLSRFVPVPTTDIKKSLLEAVYLLLLDARFSYIEDASKSQV